MLGYWMAWDDTFVIWPDLHFDPFSYNLFYFHSDLILPLKLKKGVKSWCDHLSLVIFSLYIEFVFSLSIAHLDMFWVVVAVGCNHSSVTILSRMIH
jgi:hypothetical protein